MILQSDLVLQKYLQAWSRVDPTSLGDKEKKRHLTTALSKVVYYLMDNRTNNPIDFIINGITDFLKDPDKEGILYSRTRLRLYFIYVNRIAERIITSGKEASIRKYFQNASISDLIVLSQHAYEIPKASESLLKEYQRITRAAVNKYIEIYKTLSEFMEKMVFQLYSILKILRGEHIDYNRAKTFPLSCNYNYLQKDRDFRLLVKPLDVFIRNSIAHRQRYFIVKKDFIVFKDYVNPRKRKTVTFSNFVKITRELYTSSFLACYLESFLLICKLKARKTQLRL